MERSDFTDDEWRTLQFGPYWAFIAVAAQDGELDEGEKAAFLNAIKASTAVEGALGREVARSLAEDSDSVFAAWQADDRSPADGFATIRQVLAKADADEANRYKGLLVWLAVSVADASGSWLGGNISDRERSAIQTLADMLGFNASDAVMATYIKDVLDALPR